MMDDGGGIAGRDGIRRNELPEAVMRPLARFNGEPPPAPGWFTAALAMQPERTRINVAGAGIESLAWGPRGAPGMILLHGSSAHADWWSFIAPFFAARMRVVSFSLSGMGRSDWRESYSINLFSQELLAVGQAAGIFENAVKPIAIGHSFGGMPTLQALATAGDKFRAGILLDAPIPQPEGEPQLALRRTPNRIMSNVAEAVMRFRVAPPQPVENTFILDYIARYSVKPAADGVTWCFDPFLFKKLTEPRDRLLISRVRTPLALIRGERSEVVTADTFALARGLQGQMMPEIVIPEADHHVMLDQPLAFVAAIRALLATWPTPGANFAARD